MTVRALRFRSTPTLLLLLFAACCSLQACKAGKGGSGNAADGITVKGELSGCNADSIRIFKMEGPVRTPIASAPLVTAEGTSTFELSTKPSYNGLYAIGPNPQNAAVFLLGDASALTLSGNCQNPGTTFKLAGSEMNDAYAGFIADVIEHNQKVQQLQQNMQLFSQSDPSQLQRIQGELQAENNQFFAALDSVRSRTDILGKIAGMYNYRPFGSEASHSSYPGEREYFTATFLTGYDANDPEIARLPQLFEKAQAYSSTLPQILPPAKVKESLDEALKQAEKGSMGHQNILRGFLTGMEQSKNELYVAYAKDFSALYPEDPATPQIIRISEQIGRLMEGSEAPNISAKTPKGDVLALNDLRGQYVLIDFWASWCRPCRLENPNVVKAYNKYHKSGFEILGVSLDQKQDRWLNAIDQDGLPWKHISDLGGWGSQPAAAYGVSSIPATFLLDEEGKIIGKNLRGPALEAKLKEIFGY